MWESNYMKLASACYLPGTLGSFTWSVCALVHFWFLAWFMWVKAHPFWTQLAMYYGCMHTATSCALLPFATWSSSPSPLDWEISVPLLTSFLLFSSYWQMGLQLPGHLSARQDQPMSKSQSQQNLCLEMGESSLIGSLCSFLLCSHQTASLLSSTKGQHVLLNFFVTLYNLSFAYKVVFEHFFFVSFWITIS